MLGGVEFSHIPNIRNANLCDRQVLPVVRRMMNRGMAIDIGYLEGLSDRLKFEMVELRGQIVEHIPSSLLDGFVSASIEPIGNVSTPDYTVNIDSPDQIGKI